MVLRWRELLIFHLRSYKGNSNNHQNPDVDESFLDVVFV